MPANDGRVRERGSGVGPIVAIGKDAVALLRDLSLFVLALLLLLWPGTFNRILTNAGFEEGSFAGFKWRSGLLRSDAALKEAQATITQLRSQLEQASAALAAARPNVADPAVRQQVERTQQASRQVAEVSSLVQRSLTTAISSNADLVASARRTIATGPWAVVFGGDPSLASARFEVDLAKRQWGADGAMVVLRDGVYRSVAVASSRTAAEQLLARARQRRPDAYLVALDTWCPDLQERQGFRECVK